MEIVNQNGHYQNLIKQIAETYFKGKEKAVLAVNSHIVETYWHIGQYIVEFEQDGEVKAKYGRGLLTRLSKDLSIAHGRGFSISNIARMRQFYLTFPIFAELPQKLSWTHLVEILKIDDEYNGPHNLNQLLSYIQSVKSPIFI